jgi:hypothetical protein
LGFGRDSQITPSEAVDGGGQVREEAEQAAPESLPACCTESLTSARAGLA